ncbi:hypothetical protein A0H81_02759 [Grifola frondosa]|uniref:Uncharacterized protein n=1 Tax=Grifola frondosa TaxID=5627 RepID=A0A1C7MT12_GRIFR|nr:hypothetical protein A0H81_02759 [Grifola frondosa]
MSKIIPRESLRVPPSYNTGGQPPSVDRASRDTTDTSSRHSTDNSTSVSRTQVSERRTTSRPHTAHGPSAIADALVALHQEDTKSAVSDTVVGRGGKVSPSSVLPPIQPACFTNSNTPYVRVHPASQQ